VRKYEGRQEMKINEVIRQVKGGFRLYSKKGKNLGTFDTRAGAEKHEREVQAFKHMNEDTVDVRSFANQLEQKYDLQTLFLSDMAARNAIEISSIIVKKDNQKSGTGTAAMNEIVNFADAHDKILVLSPGLYDKRHGTTSQSRLTAFYKRFGFVENKGRNKNFEFKQMMIRYPKTANQANLKEVFNQVYPWKWVRQLPKYWEAVFNDVQVTIANDPTESAWEIKFSNKGSMEITGNGDQFGIFATVLDIIREFIREKNPRVITFSAEKEDQKTKSDSRPKLYSRMVRTFANQNGYDFKEKSQYEDYVDYVLIKQKSSDSINEETGKEMLQIFRGMHHDTAKNKEMDKFIKSHQWQLGDFTPDMFPSEEEFFDYDDPFDRVIDIDYGHRVDLSSPIIVGPQFSDGKYSVIDGNHRAATAQKMGKTIKGYFPVKATTETNVAFNEATEMKISDLTISDAGLSIAQSAGGGSKTDSPLTVTKLPSGHIYLVNGYHRLVDAMKSGEDTVPVEFVPYERVEVLWKNEREQDIKYGKQFNESESDTLKLPDIAVGDEVMVGKFKNRKATVTGFKKDDHNQPVLNTTKGDQKLFKLRLSKLTKKD
jgi:hypothetical protein